MKNLSEMTCNEIENLTDAEFEEIFSCATVSDIKGLKYGLKNFAASKSSFYARAERLLSKFTHEIANPKSEEEVLCACGHKVPKSLVMTTSLGSSCPDCYDKMSI